MGLRWKVSLKSLTGPDTASVFVVAETDEEARFAAVAKATGWYGHKQWVAEKVSVCVE